MGYDASNENPNWNNKKSIASYKKNLEKANDNLKKDGYNFQIINCDTDSILINKPDGSEWTKEEQESYLQALNDQFPEKINFDNDGYYESVVVIKSKNYAMLEKGKEKVKIKGSSLRDQKKEPALKEMLGAFVDAAIGCKTKAEFQQLVPDIYMKYVNEVLNITDMTRWASKKGVTEAVTNCAGAEARTIKVTNEKGEERDKVVYFKKGKQTDIRSNEMVIWNAIKDEEIVQQGDKFQLYPAILSFEDITTTKVLKSGKEKVTTKRVFTYGLKQVKKWDKAAPDHDKEQLLKRIYDTLCIFETILDIDQFKNYSLVKNYRELVNPEGTASSEHKLLTGETTEET